MTVAQLIEHLSKLKPDLEVYTAIDDEGNGYNEMYFEPTVMLMRYDGRDAEMYSTEDLDDLEADGVDISELVEVVVL